jgi:hypothetical protein
MFIGVGEVLVLAVLLGGIVAAVVVYRIATRRNRKG